MAVAAANDGLWQSLCRACDRPDLADDERLSTDAARVGNRVELIKTLGETFHTRTADESLERLAAHGVSAGKVRGVREALAAAEEGGDPAILTAQHPTIGDLPLVRSAIRLHRGTGSKPRRRRCSGSTRARSGGSWASIRSH